MENNKQNQEPIKVGPDVEFLVRNIFELFYLQEMMYFSRGPIDEGILRTKSANLPRLFAELNSALSTGLIHQLNVQNGRFIANAAPRELTDHEKVMLQALSTIVTYEFNDEYSYLLRRFGISDYNNAFEEALKEIQSQSKNDEFAEIVTGVVDKIDKKRLWIIKKKYLLEYINSRIDQNYVQFIKDYNKYIDDGSKLMYVNYIESLVYFFIPRVGGLPPYNNLLYDSILTHVNRESFLRAQKIEENKKKEEQKDEPQNKKEEMVNEKEVHQNEHEEEEPQNKKEEMVNEKEEHQENNEQYGKEIVGQQINQEEREERQFLNYDIYNNNFFYAQENNNEKNEEYLPNTIKKAKKKKDLKVLNYLDELSTDKEDEVKKVENKEHTVNDTVKKVKKVKEVKKVIDITSGGGNGGDGKGPPLIISHEELSHAAEFVKNKAEFVTNQVKNIAFKVLASFAGVIMSGLTLYLMTNAQKERVENSYDDGDSKNSSAEDLSNDNINVAKSEFSHEDSIELYENDENFQRNEDDVLSTSVEKSPLTFYIYIDTEEYYVVEELVDVSDDDEQYNNGEDINITDLI